MDNENIVEMVQRDYGIYYSDQLELIREKDEVSIHKFTDNIAVVQKFIDDELILEYELCIFGGSESEDTILIKYFEELTA